MLQKILLLVTAGELFEIESSAWVRNESGDPAAIKLGHHVRLSGEIYCKIGGVVNVGDYSVLQDNTIIRCLESIQIGSFTGIADGCLITDNNSHAIGAEAWVRHRIRVAPGGPGYPGLGNGWEYSDSNPVKIGDAVWVGSNSTVLKGVTIGDGAIVARGSMVTKDVPPYTLVAGNPARVVKNLDQSGKSIESIANHLLENGQ